jgi:alanine dehydrogenase
VNTAAEVYARTDMIIKVKEPLRPEWPLLRRGQIIFTYFHFAADRELTAAVLNSGSVAVAYETLSRAVDMYQCGLTNEAVAATFQLPFTKRFAA